MNAQLITALFEYMASHAPILNNQPWWIDMYKLQFDYLEQLNEQMSFPCIFVEYTTKENPPALEHSVTFHVGFRNEFFEKTYLNQISGNMHIKKGGLKFITIKESLKHVLNNFRGDDFYCRIDSDTLESRYKGITIVKLDGQIYQTEC